MSSYDLPGVKGDYHSQKEVCGGTNDDSTTFAHYDPKALARKRWAVLAKTGKATNRKKTIDPLLVKERKTGKGPVRVIRSSLTPMCLNDCTPVAQEAKPEERDRVITQYRERFFIAIKSDDVPTLATLFKETGLGIDAGLFSLNRRKVRNTDHAVPYAHNCVPDFHEGYTGTCLHLASFFGSKLTVTWLLREGADPSKRDVDRRTPRDVALDDATKLSILLTDQHQRWQGAAMSTEGERERGDEEGRGIGGGGGGGFWRGAMWGPRR